MTRRLNITRRGLNLPCSPPTICAAAVLRQEALPAGRDLPPHHRPSAGDGATAAARRKDNTWPQEQLFWELHPVMQWLLDKLLICFGRHQAPVIVTPAPIPGVYCGLFRALSPTAIANP